MQTVSFTGDLFRLIPSRFPPVAVYEGLVANDRQNALAAVEAKTNPRLRSTETLAALYNDPESPKLQNWNLAPFRYINPEGSLFFDPMRPALELADDKQTALAISVKRRETFLGRTKEPPAGFDMRMLKTPVSGEFADFSGLPSDMSKDERWELGSSLPSHLAGIMFCPRERPSARCFSVIRNDVLDRTIQSSHYRFIWNGSRISLLYAFDEAGRELAPDLLALEENVIAA